MDLVARLEQFRAEERKLAWQGTFKDYFDIVISRPDVSQLAHERIFNMIMAVGTEDAGGGLKSYKFFNEELYGLDRTLQQIVDYFNSAGKRLEVRKRILLLMGPVGGGKSTIVSMLKRGLDMYTRSDGGAVYAIKSCPMHEEPLHLLPDTVRP